MSNNMTGTPDMLQITYSDRWRMTIGSKGDNTSMDKSENMSSAARRPYCKKPNRP
jgi:hypothetical protein